MQEDYSTTVDSAVIMTELEDLSYQERKNQPWRYIGYRGFCKFVTSDNDFFILRRFSVLSSRVLLALQDELCELEEQLEAQEVELISQSAPKVHGGTFREEISEDRYKIIREIDQKLRAYNELVIQHSELRSRPKVLEKDRNSLSNWFSNHHKAILEEETMYIQHPDDLFAMVPKNKTPLRRVLERSSRFRLFRWWKKKKPSPLDDENVHFTSDWKIDLCVNIIIACIGLFMLIVPLWVLAYTKGMGRRLGIITGFVLVFLCFVSFTTVARPFETLGAAAA